MYAFSLKLIHGFPAQICLEKSVYTCSESNVYFSEAPKVLNKMYKVRFEGQTVILYI